MVQVGVAGAKRVIAANGDSGRKRQQEGGDSAGSSRGQRSAPNTASSSAGQSAPNTASWSESGWTSEQNWGKLAGEAYQYWQTAEWNRQAWNLWNQDQGNRVLNLLQPDPQNLPPRHQGPRPWTLCGGPLQDMAPLPANTAIGIERPLPETEAIMPDIALASGMPETTAMDIVRGRMEAPPSPKPPTPEASSSSREDSEEGEETKAAARLLG